MRTILLIEDNPEDVDLALRAFRINRTAAEIAIARDGAEAIEWFRVHADTMPAFVLLDLKLPKLDGLEVLARLRAESATALVPVVVLTTSREESDITRAYRLGANSYVRKPVDFDEFLEVVRLLSTYWLGMNQAV